MKIIRGIGVVNTGNVYHLPVAPKRIKSTAEEVTALVGYIGLALVQLNVLPAIVKAIETGASAPILSIIMMIIGLACYLYNSVKTGNTLYTVGNAVGLVSNLILLFAVIFRGVYGN